MTAHSGCLMRFGYRRALLDIYKSCSLCPRSCNSDRTNGRKGYCGSTDKPAAARAALHMWEEPCISGKEGSGTIFFTGCALKCVYCQNRTIALKKAGKEISDERLIEIFFELAEKGANNINLVTADHFIPDVSEAIASARKRGFNLPFLLNTGSYVRPDTLKMLDGLVDIYLPDMKYYSPKTALEYSNAPDYPAAAKEAIEEMVRQLRARSSDGKVKNIFDTRGIMKQGIIVRHMLLPGHVLEAKLIVKYLHEKYGDEIYISLLNQYTPPKDLPEKYSDISRCVTQREYDSLLDYVQTLGITKGFMQEGSAADESFIPDFCCEGI